MSYQEKEKPQSEALLVWLPFPDPIVEGESVVTFDGEKVSMPYWYWQKLELYIITTEANIEKLE